MKKTTVMIKFTQEEILDVLSEGLLNDSRMTKKQKVLLGQLVIYSGLEQNKNEGYFYRSNKDLCNDCGISEKTLISGLLKLEKLGYISRRAGLRGKASEYTVNSTVNCTVKTTNCTVKSDGNYSNNYSAMEQNYSNNYSAMEQNYSTDTESDIETDIYKDQSVLGSGEIGPHIKEYLNLLSVEIRKEYEERISKLEERLNQASKNALNEKKQREALEDTLRKVVDQVNSLTKRVRELEGKHINSVDQDNNTNVGTQAVEHKSNPNSDSEVDKLIDTLKEGSKTHSASELTGAADKLQSLIDNKALMGQPSKFGLSVNLIRETKSKYKTSTVSDSKSTKRMTINRKEPTENPAEYSKLYRLHSLISDHKSVDQRIGEEYFNLIAKCKELDAAGLITSIDSFYFKSWCKPTDPAYQKCLQAVKGSNELSPSVPLAPLSEEINILVAE